MKRHTFHVQVIFPVIYTKLITVNANSQSVAESEAIERAKKLSRSDYDLSKPMDHLIECTYATEESVMDAQDANGSLRYAEEIPNPGDAMDAFEYGLLQADEDRGEGKLIATSSLLKMEPGQLADCAIDWNRASYSLNGHAVEWLIATLESKISSGARQNPMCLENGRRAVYEKYAIEPAEQTITPANEQALDDFGETPLVLVRATKEVETAVDG